MTCLKAREIEKIMEAAEEMKENPDKYEKAMKNETLLMLFQKPSLRTRVSFEVGMTQLGGHAIYYPLDSKSTLSGKESIADFAQVASRYATVIMARVSTRKTVEELAQFATVPVINALDDWGHPCQILADFQTMREHSHNKNLKGMKLSFMGDVRNNVTYDLMRGCAILGMDVAVCGPYDQGNEYKISEEVVALTTTLAKQNGSTVTVTNDPKIALEGADFVYADSWMSYGVPKEQEAERLRVLLPFQVTRSIMRMAKPTAKFLHCLPAMREAEVTAEVIDGPQSVVFDQAENRLHAQKALMLFLRGKI